MEEKEILDFDDILERLEGREYEFGNFISEMVSIDPGFDTEYNMLQLDRGRDIDHETLLKDYKNLASVISRIYKYTHAFNPTHDCCDGHRAWREEAIVDYKMLVENNITSDYFNLFGSKEISEINLDDYTHISISDPHGNSYNGFTLVSKDPIHYVYGESNHAQLILVRGVDSDLYIIKNDYIHKRTGQIVKLDFDELSARTAKQELLNDA